MNTDNPAREFDHEISISAAPTRVWELLADSATMPKVSPEVFAVTRRRRGAFREGERFLGWNRRGAVVWPTMNRIVVAEPHERLAWHTSSSGATWTYTLVRNGNSTILREQRHMPNGPSLTARLFAPILGGIGNHTDELESHVSTTLEGVKRLAES